MMRSLSRRRGRSQKMLDVAFVPALYFQSRFGCPFSTHCLRSKRRASSAFGRSATKPQKKAKQGVKKYHSCLSPPSKALCTTSSLFDFLACADSTDFASVALLRLPFNLVVFAFRSLPVSQSGAAYRQPPFCRLSFVQRPPRLVFTRQGLPNHPSPRLPRASLSPVASPRRQCRKLPL